MCHDRSFQDNVDFEEKEIITKQEDNNITRRDKDDKGVEDWHELKWFNTK